MPRIHRPMTIVSVLACLALLAGCGNDGNDSSMNPSGSGPAILGTWNASSFSVNGTNYVSQGLAVTLTFATDTYTIDVTGDANHVICTSPATDCTNGGPATLTDTTVTFDPGTAEEVTFAWTVSGSTLTLTGSIAGAALVATLTR